MYIGYVGGVAVAVGIGAALAAAGRVPDSGSEGKESSAGSPPSNGMGSGVNAGPLRLGHCRRPTPRSTKWSQSLCGSDHFVDLGDVVATTMPQPHIHPT